MLKRPAKFHSLLHSTDLLEKRLASLLAPMGIRPRQARVLNTLQRMGPASQVTLAHEFDVTAGSMSTMIERLLSLNLITRHKNPADRRGDVVALTPGGEAMLSDIKRIWSDMDDWIETALGPEKSKLLAALTTELKLALGGRMPGQDHPQQSLEDLFLDIGLINKEEQ